MDKPPKIITVTMNPSLDLATSVDRVVPGRKLRCLGSHIDPGGGGINVSRMIAELGGASECLIVAGGPGGKTLVHLLSDQGSKPHLVSIAGTTRQNLTVDERATGRQFRFVLPGPILKPEEWRRAFNALGGLLAPGSILVASGSLPPGVPANFYGRMAKIAKTQRAQFLIDASGPALKAALSAGVDLIKPNRHEFKELSEGNKDDWRSIARISSAWIRSGLARAALVTRGADGALLTTREDQWRIEAPNVRVRSAVGAGDSCLGAIAFQLARGKPLIEACRFGVAAAAAAMLTPATELARKRDVQRLVRETRVWRARLTARI